MRFHLLHPRDQLVAIMNRIYQNGMTTLSGGNLSIKDEDGGIWITPAGVDKGRLTPKDIMRVRGIGRATFRHLRPMLAVEGETTLQAPTHRRRASSNDDE